MGDTIIFMSGHKVLTRGSCFEYEFGRHRTCFAMNSDRFVAGWHVGFFPKRLLIQVVIPLWYCSCGNRSKTALRACSSSGVEKVSSLRFVFLLSSDDPGPWDPRNPSAVEPLLRPSMFHNLAESEPLETDVARFNFAHARSERNDAFCKGN